MNEETTKALLDWVYQKAISDVTRMQRMQIELTSERKKGWELIEKIETLESKLKKAKK